MGSLSSEAANMMNNLFNVIVIFALVGTFVLAPTPQPAPISPQPPATVVELQVNEAALPRDGLDRASARAAIEADGYRSVSFLGRESDGSWRARAYRDAIEVQVIVDSAGRVSAR
jgi:hypothetical protein